MCAFVEPNSSRYCDICKTEEENDELHRMNQKHLFNYRLYVYQLNKSSLRSSRYGVELEIKVKPVNGYKYDFTPQPNKSGNHYLNITPVDFKNQNNQVEFACRIKNGRTSHLDPIVITYAGVLHPFEVYSMKDPNNNIENNRFIKIEAGDSYTVDVKIKLEGHHVSNFKIPIFFSIQTFSRSNKMEAFSIARSIVVAINEKVEEAIDLEKSPFTNNRWEKVDVINPTIVKVSNDLFPIPREYFKTLMYGLKKDFGDGVLNEILKKLEPGEVTVKNYNNFFHILLWLEETGSLLGLSSYNMENVNLRVVSSKILQLDVPGLAEKRPSVIRGDYIDIKVHGDHTSYRGIIKTVGDKSVDIEGLGEAILEMVQLQPDIEIDVRFRLGRIHYERMHQAIENVVATGFVKQLFPSIDLLNRPVMESTKLQRRDLFNEQIFTNIEQLTAVEKILNNTSKGAPYIVFGPPGTGKTVTIVEAILQLKKQGKKILVCAPANAACNMLTQKLKQFCSPDDLKRVMSENCDTSSVPEDILKYSNLTKDEDGLNVIIPFLREHLHQFKIVVTTLIFAGKYFNDYHPDVVFMDEAAQAREAEACCALSLLAANKRLVLAGDPMQLGPVVYSDICKEYGYHISLLERLMELPLYKKDSQGKNNFTTMLKLNFRNHPDILELPNRLFYDNQLKAISMQARNDPLAKTNIYKLIQGGGFHNENGSAVEFCAVLAKESRQGRSPSYFNNKEVSMVKDYVKKLLSLNFGDPDHRVRPEEIGIVTPYIRQMYKIREVLTAQHIYDIEVGTTEAFQGREKRVMIISTVRAQEDLLLFDKKYRLGFVREPKRFNVAITRAKAKVIVIGNPLVLRMDSKWEDFIEESKRLGTLCGAPFPERNSKVVDEIVKRFKDFHTKDINFKNRTNE